MRARRLIALIALFAAANTQGELIAGELGEAETHHESAVSAAAHSVLAAGEHGHEDGSSPEHRHDGSHRHGGPSDHCTHQHGAALTTTWDFRLPLNVSLLNQNDGFQVLTENSSAFFRPPKV